LCRFVAHINRIIAVVIVTLWLSQDVFGLLIDRFWLQRKCVTETWLINVWQSSSLTISWWRIYIVAIAKPFATSAWSFTARLSLFLSVVCLLL